MMINTIKKMTDEEIMPCPFCNGGTVLKRVYNYECSRFGNGCSFRLKRKYLESEITPTDVKKLLGGHDIEKTVKMKKDGKLISFKSTLYLEKVERDNKIYYNIYYRKK